MRLIKRVALFLSATYLVAGLALAADVFIYPQQGQSKEQQQKDEWECYSWGKQQTGFDPMARPTATSAPPEQRSSGVVGGAARGAAGGAIGGAIAGDAGKGAAIGAAAGGMIGGMRRRQDQRRRQDWEQQQAAQYNQRRSEYNRAFGACMSGRGYTVR